MTAIDNHDLIARCRRGDNRAWQQLVQHYARLVHSIPVSYGLTAVEVDDVGQEVFLALAQGLAQLDDPQSLPAWLMTTARRCSWRTLQRRKRETTLAEGDLALTEFSVGGSGWGGQSAAAAPMVIQPLSRPLPSMAELLQGWEQQELLAAGLARMGERCRTLLTLIFLDPTEPSYDEISSRLDMPKGSIGPTRNRCLQQLRTILEGLGLQAQEL